MGLSVRLHTHAIESSIRSKEKVNDKLVAILTPLLTAEEVCLKGLGVIHGLPLGD